MSRPPEHHVHDRRVARSGRVALELQDERGRPGWALCPPAPWHVHHALVGPGGRREVLRLPARALRFHAERWAAANPHWVRTTTDERVVLLVPLTTFRRACQVAHA